jgi:hypothetical protein
VLLVGVPPAHRQAVLSVGVLISVGIDCQVDVIDVLPVTLIPDGHARAADVHLLRMGVVPVATKGLINPLLQNDRIVLVGTDVDVQSLVNINIALDGLDRGPHLIASLVFEVEVGNLLVVGFEDLGQFLFKPVPDSVPLFAECLLLFETAESYFPVKFLKVLLDICHGG